MTFTREQLIERIAEQKTTLVSMLGVMPQLLQNASVSRAMAAAEKDLRILEIALTALDSRAAVEPATVNKDDGNGN
ncbi:hypothetical protein [Atlantibacter hermannii]|uniref:hypothetical protein n=1 Tax=Atlantibacter hermannii TaxID=565 RepID=UPI00289EDDD3|nr:hypothetical protein [Atlantibacter hermannii]